MGKVTEIPASRLEDLYPLLEYEDIPEFFELDPITFMRDEIETYPVLVFHRLMKKHYGKPPQIEVEIEVEDNSKTANKTVFLTRTKKKGNWKILPSVNAQYGKIGELANKELKRPPKEWGYFISTDSGGMILVGTKKRCERVTISHVLFENNGKQCLTRKNLSDGKKFISKLLKEAKKLKGQVFSVKNEFERKKGVGLYLLNNLYLSNYGSAELMLELSEKDETHLRGEFIRYDPFKGKLSELENKHIDKYMVACGMYYQSCISYYFMALEGFVNLIYHSFLHEDYRDLDWEIGLDLEKKIRFIFALCRGFKYEHIDPKSEIIKRFKSLKNYRNQIFHSKIKDVMKSVCIIEDGFHYNYDMKEQNTDSFQANKINLEKDHVLTAKRIVDEIIDIIVSGMDSDCISMVRRFILKEIELPFWKDENGNVHLGHLPKKVG